MRSMQCAREGFVAAGSLNDPKRALRLVEPCRVFVHHCQIVQQRLDLDNTSAIVFFGRRNRGQVEYPCVRS